MDPLTPSPAGRSPVVPPAAELVETARADALDVLTRNGMDLDLATRLADELAAELAEGRLPLASLPVRLGGPGPA